TTFLRECERRWQGGLDPDRARHGQRLRRPVERRWLVHYLDVAERNCRFDEQLSALLPGRQRRWQGRLDQSGARLERRPGGALERRWQLYVLDLAERQHRRPEPLPTLFRRCQRRWTGG